ncbi:MAG: DUF4301 family protein [Paludibacteraceae bacterium]|nr:DUF4301 family protein [Paludibacteraceae bacterium]
MLTREDMDCLSKKGISEELLEEQLSHFRDGFPYLTVCSPATLGNGIARMDDTVKANCKKAWNNYLAKNVSVVKFVPASGAASRMFKSLFEFMELSDGILSREADMKFFGEIEKFAFFDELNEKCNSREGKNVADLCRQGRYKSVVSNVLSDKGLNYGALPKGLLLFHRYPEGCRTPFEEHLVEGAIYAKNAKNQVRLHYTVSQEHLELFRSICKTAVPYFAQKYGVEFDVTFSVQKPSTDTVAVDKDNNFFRKSDGSLLFRPGGHGALIENLNDIDADIIFIKNIDNVVPDNFKQDTVEYKQIIAGLLVDLQKQVHEYQRMLDDTVTEAQVNEMLDFCEKKLCFYCSGIRERSLADKIEYLERKLNRPIRVCGMVKNEGEPGGGPFLCVNPDGTRSLQILESSQFDKNDESQWGIMKRSEFFNPVDLVCAVKDYKGQKYDLPKYVDPNTGFISLKSKDGKELKALELPGLWNGAMSDWITVFVEVPVSTFNPVKVVNDLLRKEHQGI